MSDPKEHNETFSREGTPWNSPAGAIKRWIRRYRATDSDDNSPTDSELE